MAVPPTVDPNLSVVLLMGRGIEGCGVTRSTIQFQREHKNTRVFATADKQWARKTKELVAEEFLAADWSQCERVIQAANEADLFLIISMPSKSHPQECQDNFTKILQSVRTRRALNHFDHSVRSLHLNSNLEENCRAVDVILTHSLTGVLAAWLKKTGIETPLTTTSVGFDYEHVRREHWVPIEEQDDLAVRWIGRTAQWKGPELILDFHDSHLGPAGYKTILEGLEASVQWPIVLYPGVFQLDDKWAVRVPPDDRVMLIKDVIKDPAINELVSRKCLNRFRYRAGIDTGRLNPPHGTEVGGMAYCYPAYDNSQCLDRMARSAFGSDLYNLKPELYGDNIENCHAEIVAAGSIPIFHKHFGDHVRHLVTGDPLSRHSDSGTIWLDRESMDDALGLMFKLSSDRAMRDEWREMAFQFWKSTSNSKLSTQIILDHAMNTRPTPKRRTLFG